MTSTSLSADWPVQGDLVKAKHNAKKDGDSLCSSSAGRRSMLWSCPSLLILAFLLLVFYYVLLYLVQQAL